MKNIKLIVISLAVALGISVYASTPIQYKNISNQIASVQNCLVANPLDIVARPNFYLNKTVKIKGKFDKFSTLGLDYKPAMKSSENYISFLIQRPDVLDHNIPLSELKIFLNRTEAEKYIDLNSGDLIEFTGKIFSTALGDPWMEVSNFTVLSSKPKTDK